MSRGTGLRPAAHTNGNECTARRDRTAGRESTGPANPPRNWGPLRTAADRALNGYTTTNRGGP